MNMDMEKYDSEAETRKHIERVGCLMNTVVTTLIFRSTEHDKSKLLPPEKPVFDEVTGKLKGMTYGSDEYTASLHAMKPALDHHYSVNRHHPEHYENGVNGMDLLDLLEMLCDWKAATERHATGDLQKSLTINRGRFGISEQLDVILWNTVGRLGWLNKEPSTAPLTGRGRNEKR